MFSIVLKPSATSNPLYKLFRSSFFKQVARAHSPVRGVRENTFTVGYDIFDWPKCQTIGGDLVSYATNYGTSSHKDYDGCAHWGIRAFTMSVSPPSVVSRMSGIQTILVSIIRAVTPPTF